MRYTFPVCCVSPACGSASMRLRVRTSPIRRIAHLGFGWLALPGIELLVLCGLKRLVDDRPRCAAHRLLRWPVIVGRYSTI